MLAPCRPLPAAQPGNLPEEGEEAWPGGGGKEEQSAKRCGRDGWLTDKRRDCVYRSTEYGVGTPRFRGIGNGSRPSAHHLYTPSHLSTSWRVCGGGLRKSEAAGRLFCLCTNSYHSWMYLQDGLTTAVRSTYRNKWCSIFCTNKTTYFSYICRWQSVSTTYQCLLLGTSPPLLASARQDPTRTCHGNPQQDAFRQGGGRPMQ